MALAPEEVSWRGLVRGGGANAAAAVIASLAGLAVVLLAGRSMTVGEYASFASVWGLVFGCAAVLGAVEQEGARVRSLSPGPIDGTQLAVTGVVSVVGAAVLALVVALLADELHLTSVTVDVLVVVGAAVFPILFTSRGYLAGSLRFISLAGVTAGEALLRLAVVLVGLWASFAPVPTFAVAAICGTLVGWPVLLRHADRHPRPAAVGLALRRTGTLMAGFAMSAALLTGAPVLVGLSMTAAPVGDVGRMQAAVVVSRFPLIALMLLQSLLVPVFVRRRTLYADTDYPRIVLVLAVAVPLTTVASYVAGPWLLASLYGSVYTIEPAQIALLTAGATALGGAQVLIALAVAGDRHSVAPLAFGSTLVLTVLLAFIPTIGLSLRIPVAFAVGPVAGFVVALVSTLHWRRQVRRRETPVPV